MAIVRVPKVNNYTIMSNHHLIDPELSFKAKGLMSYMLSRPDNWDFTIEGLARQNKEGVDAIARIIRELEERGYVTRIRVRNQAGKFTDMEYRILECPLKKAAKESAESKASEPAPEEPIPEKPLPNDPHPENPVVDSPLPVSPLPESAGQIITESPKTEKRNTDLSNPDPSKTDPSIPDADRASEGSPRRQDIQSLTAEVRWNIGYFELREQYSQDEMDGIISLIVEVLSARCDTFTLSGRKIPADLVKSRFRALNSHHIAYIFDCMKKSGSDIRNIKQYLLTSLFNAPATLDSYYRAKVNHDFDFS